MNMRPLVSLRNVTVVYKVKNSELTALSNVSLDIMHGEVVGIVGRSGCGKTTLLKVMAGLIRPVRGEVIFYGKTKKIGMLFQNPLLLPWRTVLSNILLPIEILGEDIEVYKNRALKLLEMVGLKGFENSYPWELSGGMQQRVALCRALIHKPSLLLLDEPFSALDALTREELWTLVQDIIMHEKCTTVLVTHDIREAVILCDRVVVMNGRPGRIRAEFKIPFRRPRSLELQYAEEFNEYVAKVRDALND